MRLSLYVKFILAYVSFGITAFIAIATLSSKLTDNYLIDSGSKTLYNEANLIASSYSDLYRGESIELSDAYPQLKAIAAFLQAQIWVMDRNGEIILDSSDNMTGKMIENFDPTVSGSKPHQQGDYFGTFPYQVLSVSAPIVGNYRTNGYVVIHLPMTKVHENRNEILNIVYITFLIVFLLSTLILIVFSRIVYRPLRTITAAAKEYAGGNLTYETNVQSNDEMGYLANTLNYMSRALYETEEYQHKFIANISHDFRSPLTSIKGYLEAMQDGTIPSELHPKYINRVIQETERLTKLTNGILSLNSLDRKGKLMRTSFDIYKLVKRIAKSFELQCDQKSITIELTVDDEVESVYADQSKIEQVLYNLIDNAVKFSNEHSTIYISMLKKHDSVQISVKDTGIGIPKQDQSRIYDRFFKSDASRGKDKLGSGIGLSIVKEIIQAHNRNLTLVSTEGVGTEFIFSLPIHPE